MSLHNAHAGHLHVDEWACTIWCPAAMQPRRSTTHTQVASQNACGSLQYVYSMHSTSTLDIDWTWWYHWYRRASSIHTCGRDNLAAKPPLCRLQHLNQTNISNSKTRNLQVQTCQSPQQQQQRGGQRSLNIRFSSLNYPTINLFFRQTSAIPCFKSIPDRLRNSSSAEGRAAGN